MYIKCARPPYIIEIKDLRARNDVYPDSDAITDAKEYVYTVHCVCINLDSFHVHPVPVH